MGKYFKCMNVKITHEMNICYALCTPFVYIDEVDKIDIVTVNDCGFSKHYSLSNNMMKKKIINTHIFTF
jgi:hypothetical protein